MCSIISTCERHRRQALQYEQIAHTDIKLNANSEQEIKKNNNLNPLSIAEKRGNFLICFIVTEWLSISIYMSEQQKIRQQKKQHKKREIV